MYRLLLKKTLLHCALLMALQGQHTAVAQTSVDRPAMVKKVAASLDAIAKDFAAKNHLPGLVYGIMVNGNLVHTFATGYSNIANKTPATTQSCFRIASMTKSFTAMAILKLRDEGRLKLDDPVQLYIPEMLGQRMLTKDAGPVTIRHLLTHAAGLPEDNPWGDRQLAVSDNEMLAMIRKGLSFSNVPGVAYEYSNLGYAILGNIIKQVSGMPYQQYISESIFAPLGMTQTYWDYQKIDSERLALGYRWLNGQWVKQPMLGDGAYGAMGGLITTMEDFARYASFHQLAWPPANTGEAGPLKRSTVREMHHPWNVPTLNAAYRYPGGRACATVRSYGYGLGYNKDCQDRVWVGHGGGLPGFGSNWVIYPEYGIGIISFANVTYAPASYLNTLLIDTMLGMTNLLPLPRKGSPFLEQRKNELVKLLPLWNQAENTNIFAENFFMDYLSDSLRKESTLLFNQAGSIKSVGKMKPVNDLRGSFILYGEHKKLEVFITLTPENIPLIQEYSIREMK